MQYNLFDRLIMGIALIGAAILAFTMVITTLDVIMRYFFHSPIKGVYEIVELMMGLLSPIAILYCSWRKGHVSVDLVYTKLSGKTKRATLIVACVCTLLVAIGLALGTIPLVQEILEDHLSTPTLDLPMWPAAATICVCFMLLVPIAVAEVVTAFTKPLEDEE